MFSEESVLTTNDRAFAVPPESYFPTIVGVVFAKLSALNQAQTENVVLLVPDFPGNPEDKSATWTRPLLFGHWS